jgi:hypothetical protein
MQQIRKELLAYSRACEDLLSIEVTLNEEEHILLEYYFEELSKEFLQDRHSSANSSTTRTVA